VAETEAGWRRGSFIADNSNQLAQNGQYNHFDSYELTRIRLDMISVGELCCRIDQPFCRIEAAVHDFQHYSARLFAALSKGIAQRYANTHTYQYSAHIKNPVSREDLTY
jgi:hypothetical protein